MLHEQSVHKLQHNTKNKNIQDIIDYLHLHYNEPLSNSRLGKHFGFHPNYLNHLVSEFTSMPLQQYLIHIRLNKAMTLLQHTDMSISEIASEVGYNSVHYFSRHSRTRSASVRQNSDNTYYIFVLYKYNFVPFIYTG